MGVIALNSLGWVGYSCRLRTPRTLLAIAWASRMRRARAARRKVCVLNLAQNIEITMIFRNVQRVRGRRDRFLPEGRDKGPCPGGDMAG
jgi:hypothetical protein